MNALVKCPVPLTAMSMSQAMMPTHTTTNATNMYRATIRTPRTITRVKTAVRIVEMTSSSVLSGEVTQPAFQPATYATEGSTVESM